jgi:hypothetical protein
LRVLILLFRFFAFSLGAVYRYDTMGIKTLPIPHNIPGLMQRKLVIYSVGYGFKAWLKATTNVKVYNMDRLEACLATNRPFITVANRILTSNTDDATLDDPMLWGLMPPYVYNPDVMKWTLAGFCNLQSQRSLFY